VGSLTVSPGGGLRGKVALLTALVVLCVMVAMSAAGAYVFSREYGGALESRSLAIGKGLQLQLDRLLQYGLKLDTLVGFEEQCADVVKTYAGVEQAMVVGRDGIILFHSDAARIGQRLDDPQILSAVDAGGERVVRSSAQMAGTVAAVLPASARHGEQAGVVVVAFPERLIAEQTRRMWWQQMAVGAASLAGGLAILLLVLSAFVTRPVGRLIQAVERIQRRPLAEAQPVPIDSSDELGRFAASFNGMLAGLQRTTVSKLELERRNAEISLLSEMSHVLISALSVDEAYRLLPPFARRLFPGTDGELHIAAGGVLERRAEWRDARGEGARIDVALSSQGEALGELRLRFGEACMPGADERRLAGLMGEQLSFALGNLRLREALREQSVRDALTGLFNRRYLEETLERELARVQRKKLPLAIVMVDLDHFKRINDSFGHDAGDVVLRALAQRMQALLRGSDIVCRYGGEEFIMLLPESTAAAAATRAEELRAAVAGLALEHGGRPLGRVTLSAGVAGFPQHATSAGVLIAQADEALYAAKNGGRNRVVVARTAAPLQASAA
jgi:diguanylate cyclase (GGDEF)-like protein